MARSEKQRPYTSKQMGDACEMLVAAELTLAGIPAMKAPDYWPGYDAIAQPVDRPPQRISVKARTFKRGSAFVDYRRDDDFDWLAIVILPAEGHPDRRIYVVPRGDADAVARSYASEMMDGVREFRIDEVDKKFGAFENNFILSIVGTPPSAPPAPSPSSTPESSPAAGFSRAAANGSPTSL